MSPALYVTKASSGRIHLAGTDEIEIANVTLCGRPILPADIIGDDETVSGIRAGCADCKSILRARNR